MKPGHENCPHDTIVSWSVENTRYEIICEHYHSDPVQALDGTNTDPIVADYCNCCGTMRRREDYR